VLSAFVIHRPCGFLPKQGCGPPLARVVDPVFNFNLMSIPIEPERPLYYSVVSDCKDKEKRAKKQIFLSVFRSLCLIIDKMALLVSPLSSE
jgi:hypothetical protein